MQALFENEVKIAAQQHRQVLVGQVGREVERGPNARRAQHFVGVVAHAAEQVGQAVVVGVEAPQHVVELAHGRTAGFGKLAQLLALAGGVGQAVLQAAALLGNLVQQRAHVVVQVGGQGIAQIGLAAALLPAVAPQQRRPAHARQQGQGQQPGGQALAAQAGQLGTLVQQQQLGAVLGGRVVEAQGRRAPAHVGPVQAVVVGIELPLRLVGGGPVAPGGVGQGQHFVGRPQALGRLRPRTGLAAALGVGQGGVGLQRQPGAAQQRQQQRHPQHIVGGGGFVQGRAGQGAGGGVVAQAFGHVGQVVAHGAHGGLVGYHNLAADGNAQVVVAAGGGPLALAAGQFAQLAHYQVDAVGVFVAAGHGEGFAQVHVGRGVLAQPRVDAGRVNLEAGVETPLVAGRAHGHGSQAVSEGLGQAALLVGNAGAAAQTAHLPAQVVLARKQALGLAQQGAGRIVLGQRDVVVGEVEQHLVQKIGVGHAAGQRAGRAAGGAGGAHVGHRNFIGQLSEQFHPHSIGVGVGGQQGPHAIKPLRLAEGRGAHRRRNTPVPRPVGPGRVAGLRRQGLPCRCSA